MIQLIGNKNFKFLGFQQDHLFQEMQRGEGFIDTYLIPEMERYVKKDSICIDVGANLGYVSIYLSKKCKYLYALEPQPIVYLQLCGNLFLNECWNVKALELAAHSIDCNLDFAKYQSGWVGTDKFDDYHKIGSIGSISLSQNENGKMKAVRLDSIISEKIDFIKIDAQGADIDIVFGCEKIIQNSRPAIVFEYEPDLSINNYSRKLDDPDFVEFLKKYNYEMVCLFGDNYVLEPK
jgi:FkbM family methyltransferase